MSFDIEFRKQGEGAIGFVYDAHGIKFTSDLGNEVDSIHGGRYDPMDGWTIEEAMKDFDAVVVEPSRHGCSDEVDGVPSYSAPCGAASIDDAVVTRLWYRCELTQIRHRFVPARSTRPMARTVELNDDLYERLESNLEEDESIEEFITELLNIYEQEGRFLQEGP